MEPWAPCGPLWPPAAVGRTPGHLPPTALGWSSPACCSPGPLKPPGMGCQHRRGQGWRTGIWGPSSQTPFPPTVRVTPGASLRRFLLPTDSFCFVFCYHLLAPARDSLLGWWGSQLEVDTGFLGLCECQQHQRNVPNAWVCFLWPFIPTNPYLSLGWEEIEGHGALG